MSLAQTHFLLSILDPLWRYGHVSTPPPQVLSLSKVAECVVEFSFLSHMSSSHVNSTSIPQHHISHPYRIFVPIARNRINRKLPISRGGKSNAIAENEERKWDSIQSQNTNRIPGPLTLRMMLREVSSMNSTRT